MLKKTVRSCIPRKEYETRQRAMVFAVNKDKKTIARPIWKQFFLISLTLRRCCYDPCKRSHDVTLTRQMISYPLSPQFSFSQERMFESMTGPKKDEDRDYLLNHLNFFLARLRQKRIGNSLAG